MNKQDKIKNFDPNGVAGGDQLFGSPFTYEESETIVMPVPWEVTVSYSAGTSEAPMAIEKASHQVDLYDPLLENAWQRGIFMEAEDRELALNSNRYRKIAEQHIDGLVRGRQNPEAVREVNEACQQMVEKVKQRSGKIMDEGKRLVLLGGDHSTPLGFIQALAERHESFGILQIDAHADLRESFEGFKYSHASIMYNALKVSQVEKLVQVGIRDYCEEEVNYIRQAGQRVKTYYDRDLKQARFRGTNWEQQCGEIISELPLKVYLSFDIDGLDPKLCPTTGTPVAGGFEVEEVLFLLEKLVDSGREIIGLDLNEVVPGEDEWDANVAARLLYKLCNLMALSAGK